MPKPAGYKKNIKYKKHFCYIKDVTEYAGTRNGIDCKICGKHIKSVSGMASHTLNAHCLNIDDYILKYFKNITTEFVQHKCQFCNNMAKPQIQFDIKNETYKFSYPEGYMCFEPECRDGICLQFFGKHYEECKQEYEHIGAKSEFLAQRYGISIDNVKQKIKRNPYQKLGKESVTNLEGYILRYGKKLGKKKYKERCEKISKSLKIEWWIEKYGLEEGTKKYQKRFNNAYEATKDITHSKNQYALFNKIKTIDPNWKNERYAGGCARVDMLNADAGIVIEYFGDYWHCNPAVYNKDFFNKSIKKTASEKWESDKIRFQKIFLYSKTIELIIVVWEKSFITSGIDLVFAKIQSVIQKHIKGKKEIIWI